MPVAAFFEDRELALSAHGVPVRIARQRFEGGLPRVPGHDLATWTGDSEAWALTFYGVPDAGKSVLAAQLLWLRLPYVDTAAWWRASRLIDAHFGFLGGETRNRACQDCHADILVIDDLGRGMGCREVDILCNVIAARHDEGLDTIFTFNVPLATLHPALVPRLTTGTIAVPFEQTYEERMGLCC